MAFTQRSAPEQAGILQRGESSRLRGYRTAVVPPVTLKDRRLNLWRFGGLAGGLAYSLAFWVLAFHGGRAVLAWIAPETPAAIVAVATPPPGLP